MNRILKKILYWFPVVLVGVALALNALSLLYPVIWGLNVSFKDVIDYTIFPNKITTSFQWENWTQFFSRLRVEIVTAKGIFYVGFGRMFLNNVIWAVFSPLPGTIFTLLMAYVIAIFRNAFTKFLYNLGIVLMCLVIVGSFPAQIYIYNKLGIMDNMLLFILISPQGCFSGFNFLLYYNMYSAVPRDYADAAKVDGAGRWVVYYVVYLPYVLTTAFCFYILAFIGAWNDYSTFLIYLPSYPNLAYGVYLYQYDAVMYGATWPEIIAGFFIVAIPSAALYLGLDKQLVARLQVSGLKG